MLEHLFGALGNSNRWIDKCSLLDYLISNHVTLQWSLHHHYNWFTAFKTTYLLNAILIPKMTAARGALYLSA